MGLPPTPEEVDAFVNDSADNAYERLVDRLLASPQYGVRWARHWLDVVRFGESNGFEYDEYRGGCLAVSRLGRRRVERRYAVRRVRPAGRSPATCCSRAKRTR